MSDRTCSVSDCDKRMYCRKMCRVHYDRTLRLGSTDLPVRPVLLCVERGCDQRAHARGHCANHYAAARERGDFAEFGVFPQDYGTDTPCAIPGCDSTAVKGRRGMCRKHAARIDKHGDPNRVDPRRKRRNGVELCSVEGCDKVSKAYLLCVTHATRFGRTGLTGLLPGVCTICTAVFTRTNSRHICCSIECRKELVARDGYAQRRRALQKEQTTERFTRQEIFERDDWICQLCNEPIDRQARARASRSASLDHIIPLFHGGEHSRANTQCAHFGCNARKGARMKPPT